MNRETLHRQAVRQALHDFSQPLTRLQWRLELSRRGSDSELREAIDGALADSLELIEWMASLRRLMEGTEETQGSAA